MNNAIIDELKVLSGEIKCFGKQISSQQEMWANELKSDVGKSIKESLAEMEKPTKVQKIKKIIKKMLNTLYA